MTDAAQGHVDGHDAPVNVLITFPSELPTDQVARVRQMEPRVSVSVHIYEEPTSFRARRRARDAPEALRASAPDLTPEQQRAFAAAEVMLGFDVPIDVARWAPRLRWLQTPSTGIDQLWAAGLEQSGVSVTNTVGIASVSIAEFAMARILGIWKRFPELDELQRERRWEAAYGRRLAGCTLAVIGLGTIGNEIALRAKAFGMTVLGIRRTPERGAGAADEVHPPSALHAVLSRCDVAVVCAPATSETKLLIDRPALAAMPRGSVLINVARGSHVDEAALVDSLVSGHLGAAAIDVALSEPLLPDSPLWTVPRLYVSPHSCASLDGYWESVYDIFLDNLDRYLAHKPLHHVVDLATGYGTPS